MQYLGSENTIADALSQLLILFERGEHSILVINASAPKWAFKKLYKRAGKYFYCKRVSDGFVIQQIRPRGYHIIYS